MQHSTVDTIKKKEYIYSAGSKKKKRSVACHSWQVEKSGENKREKWGRECAGWKALMEISEYKGGRYSKLKWNLSEKGN